MAILQVQTNYGRVQGVRGNNPGFSVFKGIPYAAPPVGALRYAPPQPPEAWQGVRVCDRWNKACMQDPGSHGLYQKEFYPEPKQMDEDCLYLSIWTPAETGEERLPVFFWIHGGGYSGGYSYEMEFDGEAMCKRGCILVSIDYRCNSFGFFAHPELTKRNGCSGNQGMLDQVAALKWVHENIAAFGGDPDNITVHGQSAGAMSTKTLLTSPLCRGLMKHAIVQSGGGINDWSKFLTMQEQEQLGVRILELAGLTLDELMALPAQEAFTRLQEAARLVSGSPMALIFVPCVDGQALLESTGESIYAGRVNTDSIMCGSVAGDFRLNSAVEDADPDAAQKARVGAFASQQAWGAHNAANGRAPIYSYFFDRALPGDDNGSFHSCELWYMFGTMSRCWRPWTGYDYALSDAMVDYWCNFARTGDPNGGELPRWPAFTQAEPMTMCFSDGVFGAKALGEEPYAAEMLPAYIKP